MCFRRLKSGKKNTMRFELTTSDLEKIDKWLHEEVYPPIVASQKSDERFLDFIVKDGNGREIPYEGAIAGGLTYSFTPTGLGTVVQVQYGDKKLDLTEYEDW